MLKKLTVVVAFVNHNYELHIGRKVNIVLFLFTESATKMPYTIAVFKITKN